MLDDVLVPKDGRHVRCISCQHTWWQMPDKPAVVDTPAFLDLMGGDHTIEAPSSSQHRFKRVGLILCLALFFFVISCLVFGRNMIVAFWPTTEKAYALLSLPINLPGAGLAVSNANSLVLQEGPMEMVVVRGDVTNTSNRVRLLSPLKIKIIGPGSSSDHQDAKPILDHWEHHFSETSLLPGEQIHFETAPRPKIGDTQYVAVEF